MIAATLVLALLQGAPQGDRPAAAPSDAGDAVRMGVVVRPETVTVGDRFTVQVRVRAPRGSVVTFPEGPDSGATVEATDPRVVQRAADGTAEDLTATYHLVAWDTGAVALGLGDVVVAGTAGRAIPLAASRIVVASVLPPDTALHVPKPPRDIVAARPPLWPWIVLALLVLALIALLAWWLWRRRRRGRAAGPGVDPYEVAEREFARIEGLGLLEAGERGRFVALVVEVLRDYLAARLPDAALSLTSAELVRALRARPEVPAQRLASLLYEADLVKFARRPVTDERAHELAGGAREVVREVERRVEAARAAAEARAA
jgi:hypothetical protein